MNLLSKIRCNCFWLLDSLKGSKIRKHLKEIEKVQEDFLSESSQNLQKGYMNNLLDHATSSTDFYGEFKGLDISNFPVIDKNIFRENEAKFQSKTYINKPKKLVSSSGSTGATIKLYHDANKNLRNIADNIYFQNLVGFEVGEKLYYIRVWWYKLKKIQLWCKNLKPLDVLKFNDDEYMMKLVENLSSKKEAKSIIGYASALEKICIYLDKIKAKPFVTPRLKSVIAISEGLNDYTKEKIKYYFNTPVYSRYSNSENGIIAQQLPNSKNNFTINWASYYVEILKLEDDTPANSEEIGRIVITDLFNFSMPMIRYDTGDLGSIDYSTVPPTFKRIDGRKTDVIYNTKGEFVSSMIIVRPHLSEGVIQTQLIQEGKKSYTLKLNVTKSFKDEQTIINKFKSILGSDSVIKIEYVNNIPILASGKRRATINNYVR